MAQKNVTMIIMIGIEMYYLFKKLPIADPSHPGDERGQQWAIFHYKKKQWAKTLEVA